MPPSVSLQLGDFSSSSAFWDSSDPGPVFETGRIRITGGGKITVQDISSKVFSGEQYILTGDLQSSVPSTCVPYVKIGSNQITHNKLELKFSMPSGLNEVEIGSLGCGDSDSVFIDNLELRFADASIMNYNGSFFGCLADPSYGDEVNGGDLVAPVEACEVRGDFFCEPQGDWNDEDAGILSSLRDTPKSVPAELTGTLGLDNSCCQASGCWNGTGCAATEENETTLINPIRTEDITYRCIAGDWQETVEQCTWDKSDCSSFCSSPTQCMVDPNGNPANNNNPDSYKGEGADDNPQCIESGQFIGDHYCDDSKWTSRTKIIASQLFAIIKPDKDFILYCDHYTNSLPDYELSESYLGGEIYNPFTDTFQCNKDNSFECVNNFCILRYEDQITLVTSLNEEINSTDYSFLNVLGRQSTYCDVLADTNSGFNTCAANDKRTWYADKYQAILFSDKDIQPTIPSSETPSFVDEIREIWFQL